jgi:3-oxoacyl-[acyl-carrier-protein] synthase III
MELVVQEDYYLIHNAVAVNALSRTYGDSRIYKSSGLTALAIVYASQRQGIGDVSSPHGAHTCTIVGEWTMKIASYLPEQILHNSEFESLGWSVRRIEQKTGIVERRISGPDEFALDLAEHACRNLFSMPEVDPGAMDYLIYCTQSPDYLIPNNSSILQNRLGLPTTMAAIDITQGCSGYLYGLSLAKGVLQSGQSERVLLVTTETYSKHINPLDRSARSVFGDGATATCLDRDDAERIGHFVFGTDGSGADNLCVRNFGLRHRDDMAAAVEREDESGNVRSESNLFMNGPEIFSFTLRVIPQAVEAALHRSGLEMDAIDLFIFHQANGFMLEHLRAKMEIPPDKFPVMMRETGNTVSSTIPLVIERLMAEGKLDEGTRTLVAGFGVGYSWAATTLDF